MTAAKDQGKCNAGWAYSVAAVFEAFHKSENDELVGFSADSLIECVLIPLDHEGKDNVMEAVFELKHWSWCTLMV